MVDRVFFILPYNYRFQDNWSEAAASANEFGDVAKCDSDREIEGLNETEIVYFLYYLTITDFKKTGLRQRHLQTNLETWQSVTVTERSKD